MGFLPHLQLVPVTGNTEIFRDLKESRVRAIWCEEHLQDV